MSFTQKTAEAETKILNARREQIEKYDARRADLQRKAEAAAYEGRTELFNRYTDLAEDYTNLIDDVLYEIERDWR